MPIESDPNSEKLWTLQFNNMERNLREFQADVKSSLSSITNKLDQNYATKEALANLDARLKKQEENGNKIGLAVILAVISAGMSFILNRPQ